VVFNICRCLLRIVIYYYRLLYYCYTTLARIPIQEYEWERTKKLLKQHDEDIKNLKQQIQSHPRDITSIPDSLTPPQSDVFRYVSEHPQCNKTDVERYLKDKGKGSKVTVLKAISDLREHGLIRDEISKNNRQTHSLVVNNANELSILIQELNKFEKHFFSLIEKLKEGSENPESNNESFEKYGALEDILSVYQFILKAYLIRAIYIWPGRVSDDESLSKLYTILFSRLSKMQLELVKRTRIIFEQYDLVEGMILKLSRLPVSNDNLFESAKLFHYEKELKDVLAVADDIGSEVKKAAYKNSRGKVKKDGRDKPVIRIGGRGIMTYSPISVPGEGVVS
jgi:hypothetical protein